MSATETVEAMSEEGRALLTDREKEILSGEADVSDNHVYKTRSIVRNRVRKRLGADIDFLNEHFPEAHEIAHQEVCNRPNEGEEDDE